MNKSCSLIVATLALSSLLFTQGCATGGNHPAPVAVGTNGIVQIFGNDVNPQAVGTAITLAATAGTAAALHYDQNSRAYLQAVEVILDAAVQNGQYDPALLAQSLSSISIKEARDPNVNAGINGAFALYATLYGSIVSTKINDASPYLAPILTGFAKGIANGLLANPPPPTTANPPPH